MSRTYPASGIILKTMAMGEADRLLSILSPEQGLIRAIAPGARKPKSKLGGRTALFVVNQMLLVKGRSLDKLIQADVKESFPKLSQNLAKLTTAQYWAELALMQCLSDQPQPDLYDLIVQGLQQLETTAPPQILSVLLEGVGALLYLAGIAPQLDDCCYSQRPIEPEHFQQSGGVYFSIEAGGTVLGTELSRGDSTNQQSEQDKTDYTRKSGYLNIAKPTRTRAVSPGIVRLSWAEWTILKSLFGQVSPPSDPVLSDWLAAEKLLRQYAQVYFDRTIRSATLIESVFP